MRTQKKTDKRDWQGKIPFSTPANSAYIDYLPGSLCVEAHFALLGVSSKKNGAR